jgi:hypothetical protein
MRVNAAARSAIVALLALLTSACPATLVQPYDEKLVSDTEAIYKKAATMVNEGEAVSPRTDDVRRQIKEPAKHAGHFSAFAARYDALIVDADALILRGMAGSGGVDKIGRRIQDKIEDLIADAVPSACDDLEQEFKGATLTVKNYVDLKCILVRWKAQHSSSDETDKTLILKKANWEGRRRIFFNAVLAIQQAEAFKKPQ